MIFALAASRHFQPGGGPSRGLSVIVKLSRTFVAARILYNVSPHRRPAPPEPEPEVWGGDHQIRRHQFELLLHSDAALLAWLQVCRVLFISYISGSYSIHLI